MMKKEKVDYNYQMIDAGSRSALEKKANMIGPREGIHKKKNVTWWRKAKRLGRPGEKIFKFKQKKGSCWNVEL